MESIEVEDWLSDVEGLGLVIPVVAYRTFL